MKCLLCKEKLEFVENVVVVKKPVVVEMTGVRTQLLGHLVNSHFSKELTKELTKEYGACAEGDNTIFCVQDQKTPGAKGSPMGRSSVTSVKRRSTTGAASTCT